jgi:hypothetical protein
MVIIIMVLLPPLLHLLKFMSTHPDLGLLYDPKFCLKHLIVGLVIGKNFEDVDGYCITPRHYTPLEIQWLTYRSTDDPLLVAPLANTEVECSGV